MRYDQDEYRNSDRSFRDQTDRSGRRFHQYGGEEDRSIHDREERDYNRRGQESFPRGQDRYGETRTSYGSDFNLGGYNSPRSSGMRSPDSDMDSDSYGNQNRYERDPYPTQNRNAGAGESRGDYGRGLSNSRNQEFSNRNYGADQYNPRNGRGFSDDKSFFRNYPGRSNWYMGDYSSAPGGAYESGFRSGEHNFGEHNYSDRYTGEYPRSDSGDRGEHKGMWESVKDFFGVGPKGYSRPDESIREDISEALTRDRNVDASDIELEVKEGIVTLKGSVTDKWMKRQAEDCAEEVSGVKEVRNQLEVRKERYAGASVDTSGTLGTAGMTGVGTSAGTAASTKSTEPKKQRRGA